MPDPASALPPLASGGLLVRDANLLGWELDAPGLPGPLRLLHRSIAVVLASIFALANRAATGSQTATESQLADVMADLVAHWRWGSEALAAHEEILPPVGEDWRQEALEVTAESASALALRIGRQALELFKGADGLPRHSSRVAALLAGIYVTHGDWVKTLGRLLVGVREELRIINARQQAGPTPDHAEAERLAQLDITPTQERIVQHVHKRGGGPVHRREICRAVGLEDNGYARDTCNGLKAVGLLDGKKGSGRYSITSLGTRLVLASSVSRQLPDDSQTS